MARLIMRRGPTSGTIFTLTADTITIGRGSKNDIVIQDNEVSREHCRLVRSSDDYGLEDLNSSNGTFVNGQRVVRSWTLRHGYLIELGDSITFEYERPEAFLAENAQGTPTAEATHYGALIVRAGPEVGRMYTLINPVVNIGRDLANDVIIQNPEVSRYHARVRKTNNGYEIEDLGSTNGTQINDEYIHSPSLLSHNDLVRLGAGIELQFLGGVVLSGMDDRTTTLRPFTREATGITDNLKPGVPSYVRPGSNPLETSMLGTGLEPGVLEEHVFVAYGRDDWEPRVAELTVSLQDAGVQVWTDQHLTQGSVEWRAAVDQALYECWLMVVVISAHSASAPYVKTSYRYFMNHDKPLVPLIYEAGMTLPLELARKRPIIFDNKNPSRTLHQLIYEIKELNKRRP
jgi:pSer/pThr/pTyr-binding forkhead associated (FHA) protein